MQLKVPYSVPHKALKVPASTLYLARWLANCSLQFDLPVSRVTVIFEGIFQGQNAFLDAENAALQPLCYRPIFGGPCTKFYVPVANREFDFAGVRWWSVLILIPVKETSKQIIYNLRTWQVASGTFSDTYKMFPCVLNYTKELTLVYNTDTAYFLLLLHNAFTNFFTPISIDPSLTWQAQTCVRSSPGRFLFLQFAIYSVQNRKWLAQRCGRHRMTKNLLAAFSALSMLIRRDMKVRTTYCSR